MKLLVLCPDQGSDAVCVYNFLAHKFGVNVEARWGPSHRAWNCAKASIRFAQLWCHEVLMSIWFNSDFGTWHDDERRLQALDVLHENFTP